MFFEKNLLKKENVFSIDKGFEDSFTDETVIDAFNTYCGGFNLDKIERNDKPLFEYIRKKYWEITKKPLNKIDFGVALVSSSINNDTLKDTLMYKYLDAIFSKTKSP